MTNNQFHNMTRKEANRAVMLSHYLDLSPKEWAELGRSQGKEYFQAGFELGRDTPTYSEIFDMVYINNFKDSYNEYRDRYRKLISETKMAFREILSKRLNGYYGNVFYKDLQGSFPYYHAKIKVRMDDNIAIVGITVSVDGLDFTMISGELKEVVAHAIKLEYKELYMRLFVPYITAFFNQGTLWDTIPDPTSKGLIKIGNLID